MDGGTIGTVAGCRANSLELRLPEFSAMSRAPEGHGAARGPYTRFTSGLLRFVGGPVAVSTRAARGTVFRRPVRSGASRGGCLHARVRCWTANVRQCWPFGAGRLVLVVCRSESANRAMRSWQSRCYRRLPSHRPQPTTNSDGQRFRSCACPETVFMISQYRRAKSPRPVAVAPGSRGA